MLALDRQKLDLNEADVLSTIMLETFRIILIKFRGLLAVSKTVKPEPRGPTHRLAISA